MQNPVTLVAVTHTHTHTQCILQNKEKKVNLISKVRVGEISTLKSMYKNRKESIMLKN